MRARPQGDFIVEEKNEQEGTKKKQRPRPPRGPLGSSQKARFGVGFGEEMNKGSKSRAGQVESVIQKGLESRGMGRRGVGLESKRK